LEAQRLNDLLERYLQKTATASEREELFAVVRLSEKHDAFEKAAAQMNLSVIPSMPLQEHIGDEILQAILVARGNSSVFTNQGNNRVHRPAHRNHFLKTAWFRYAAAFILVAGAATVVSVLTHRNKEQTVVNANQHVQENIAPGGNKAILTLADGTTITLDSASNGQLAQQGNARVVKLSNGEIVYNVNGVLSKEVMWNTMSTPTGGQYQVTLPDGTRVWLNAASSITYPAAFVENARNVKVTGEVYFEVARNKARPFIVDVDGKSLVEALGTSFNINSYADESHIRTTLFEGAVKVMTASGNLNGQPNSKADSTVAGPSDRQTSGTAGTGFSASVLLKPGQQATMGNSAGIIVKSNIDLAQALAWKNGIFDFTGADLKAVMRQLERWYDIKVQYDGAISDEVFKGKMYRNVNLSDLLETLEQLGVKFKLEGRKLIVH